MGLFAAVRSWTDDQSTDAHPTDDQSTDDQPTDNQPTDTTVSARCRNCGRYYEPANETCPHCGSGNKIRGGAPDGQPPR